MLLPSLHVTSNPPPLPSVGHCRQKATKAASLFSSLVRRQPGTAPGPDCTRQEARELRPSRSPKLLTSSPSDFPGCPPCSYTFLPPFRLPGGPGLLQLGLETQGPGAQGCELGWVVCGFPAGSADASWAASAPAQGNTVESEHLSELTEEEYEAHYIRRQDLKGFLWLDAKYLNPFFTRRLTQEVGRRPGTGAGWAGAAHALGGVGASSHSAFSPSQTGGLDRLVGLGICCLSSAALFSPSLIVGLLTQFGFPGW